MSAAMAGVVSRRAFLAWVSGVCAVLASAPVRARALASVRIATGVTPPSIHNIWLHVAYERGFLRDNGIDVAEFIQLRGGPLAMQAIASGQVDIAPSDPEGLLSAAIAGHPVRGVAAPGSHLSYFVAVRGDLRSIGDLEGKSFAISRPGAISQYAMFPLLERAGVPRLSVQWLAVGGGYERMLALRAGRVHGALLNVEYAMEVAGGPDIRLIQSVDDAFPEYPAELLVLRKEMVDRNVEAATAITRAVIQACRYIVTNKAGTIEVTRKYNPGTGADVLGRAHDELVRVAGFGVNGGMTETNLKIAHDLALQNRQIDQAVPLDRWIDLRFQKRALESLGRFPE
jgi:NitT/TauT family transport system substrate-binding protein